MKQNPRVRQLLANGKGERIGEGLYPLGRLGVQGQEGRMDQHADEARIIRDVDVGLGLAAGVQPAWIILENRGQVSPDRDQVTEQQDEGQDL